MQDFIYDRRSIRKYKTTPLPPQALTFLLEAGFQAPTAKGLKPWHFIAVDDRELLNRIEAAHPHAAALKQAPVCIVVCADIRISEQYSPIDSAAATQNILIKANQLGFGSLWCVLYPEKKYMSALAQILNIPSHILPFSLVVVGYADDEKARPHRYQEDRVHSNGWD